MRSLERSDRLHWCHAGGTTLFEHFDPVWPLTVSGAARRKTTANQQRHHTSPSTNDGHCQIQSNSLKSRSQWSLWSPRSKRLQSNSRLKSFSKPLRFCPHPFSSHPLVPVPTDIAWCSRPECRPRILATICKCTRDGTLIATENESLTAIRCPSQETRLPSKWLAIDAWHMPGMQFCSMDSYPGSSTPAMACYVWSIL